MAEVELKPCPFCGNLAQIKKRESVWEKKTWFSVRCITSQCCGHPIEPYELKSAALLMTLVVSKAVPNCLFWYN